MTLPRRVALSSQELEALARELTARGASFALVPRGASMLPNIADGQKLVLRPPRVVAVGDVVLARVGPRLFLHRVAALRGGEALLWGDALPSADGWVKRDDLLAVADAPRLLVLRRRVVARLRSAVRRVVRSAA